MLEPPIERWYNVRESREARWHCDEVDGKYMIIDIHTHVLPGIDDGAKDWDVCMRMLAKSAECGVGQIIATPHYLPWKKGKPADEIRRLCRNAKEDLRRKYGINMDIYPGHEIYYGIDVVQDLKKGKILTLAGSRYVLVEFGTKATYREISRAVRDFRNEGYIPILAHVERYDNLHDLETLRTLKAEGALLQMNVEAFQGSIFNAQSKWAKRCIRDGVIDFLGSDMHDLKARSPITEEKLKWIQAKLKPEYQEKILFKNSRKILADVEE